MVLCLASLIAVVDITIVSIALPAIRRELGFSDSGVPSSSAACCVVRPRR
jgi:hypothetical protein